MSESQNAKEYFAKITAQFARCFDMLAYLKDGLDKAVLLVDNPPPMKIVQAAEVVWCIKALAPMSKVYDYLANPGAMVYAIVGTQAALNNAALVQVVSSFPGLTKIRAQGKEPVVLTNPAKFILALFFFEAGA